MAVAWLVLAYLVFRSPLTNSAHEFNPQPEHRARTAGIRPSVVAATLAKFFDTGDFRTIINSISADRRAASTTSTTDESQVLSLHSLLQTPGRNWTTDGIPSSTGSNLNTRTRFIPRQRGHRNDYSHEAVKVELKSNKFNTNSSKNTKERKEIMSRIIGLAHNARDVYLKLKDNEQKSKMGGFASAYEASEMQSKGDIINPVLDILVHTLNSDDMIDLIQDVSLQEFITESGFATDNSSVPQTSDIPVLYNSQVIDVSSGSIDPSSVGDGIQNTANKGNEGVLAIEKLIALDETRVGQSMSNNKTNSKSESNFPASQDPSLKTSSISHKLPTTDGLFKRPFTLDIFKQNSSNVLPGGYKRETHSDLGAVDMISSSNGLASYIPSQARQTFDNGFVVSTDLKASSKPELQNTATTLTDFEEVSASESNTEMPGQNKTIMKPINLNAESNFQLFKSDIFLPAISLYNTDHLGVSQQSADDKPNQIAKNTLFTFSVDLNQDSNSAKMPTSVTENERKPAFDYKSENNENVMRSKSNARKDNKSFAFSIDLNSDNGDKSNTRSHIASNVNDFPADLTETDTSHSKGKELKVLSVDLNANSNKESTKSAQNSRTGRQFSVYSVDLNSDKTEKKQYKPVSGGRRNIPVLFAVDLNEGSNVLTSSSSVLKDTPKRTPSETGGVEVKVVTTTRSRNKTFNLLRGLVGRSIYPDGKSQNKRPKTPSSVERDDGSSGTSVTNGNLRAQSVTLNRNSTPQTTYETHPNTQSVSSSDGFVTQDIISAGAADTETTLGTSSALPRDRLRSSSAVGSKGLYWDRLQTLGGNGMRQISDFAGSRQRTAGMDNVGNFPGSESVMMGFVEGSSPRAAFDPRMLSISGRISSVPGTGTMTPKDWTVQFGSSETDPRIRTTLGGGDLSQRMAVAPAFGSGMSSKSSGFGIFGGGFPRDPRGNSITSNFVEDVFSRQRSRSPSTRGSYFGESVSGLPVGIGGLTSQRLPSVVDPSRDLLIRTSSSSGFPTNFASARTASDYPRMEIDLNQITRSSVRTFL